MGEVVRAWGILVIMIRRRRSSRGLRSIWNMSRGLRPGSRRYSVRRSSARLRGAIMISASIRCSSKPICAASGAPAGIIRREARRCSFAGSPRYCFWRPGPSPDIMAVCRISVGSLMTQGVRRFVAACGRNCLTFPPGRRRRKRLCRRMPCLLFYSRWIFIECSFLRGCSFPVSSMPISSIRRSSISPVCRRRSGRQGRGCAAVLIRCRC